MASMKLLRKTERFAHHGLSVRVIHSARTDVKDTACVPDGGGARPVLRGDLCVFPLFEEGADMSVANAGGVGRRSFAMPRELDGDGFQLPRHARLLLACPPPLRRGGNIHCSTSRAPRWRKRARPFKTRKASLAFRSF